jgi:hypothetical protein
MIDVLHPSHSEQNFDISSMNKRPFNTSLAQQESGANDSAPPESDYAAEEAAWLESIRAADEDTIHMPRHGALVMDVSLRDSHKAAQQDIA